MNQIKRRYINALELDKVLLMLSERAVTDDAKAAAKELMALDNLDDIRREMLRTDDTHTMLVKYGLPQISGIKDCCDSLKRAKVGANLSLRELISIGSLLRSIRLLHEWRTRCDSKKIDIDLLFDMLTPHKYLEETLASSIISDEELSDNASPLLADIRRGIRAVELKVRQQLDRMIHSAVFQKYLQEQLVTMRGGRFVVPVKTEFRNEVKGLVHDISSSGATVFIEPIAVVEANNEIRFLKSKEEQEIERIIYELSAEVGEHSDAITDSYGALVKLDLYFAKARLGADMKAFAPEITGSGATLLKKARHPLISPDKVVPIDITLGQSFDTLVITGPNTGGKTVALKTVGLLTLMAMCGLMIPAQQGSVISAFKKVLVDIGDEQSIEQNLSTFSSHMTNIISIMKLSDKNSLVLLDELGAGTDPVEGAALAVAIIERLRASGAKIVATTHYPEIKMFALQNVGVENACCEFDITTLRPTYRLLIGVPGRSNAFAISERLGLDETVIERARLLIDSESTRFEDVVSELEASRQGLESERSAALELRIRAQAEAEEINRYKSQIEKEREREIEKARMEARKLIDNIKYESEKIINDLMTIKRQKDEESFAQLAIEARAKHKSTMRAVEELADPVSKPVDEAYVLPRPLKKGDIVRVAGMSKDCTVLTEVDSSGYIQIQSGMIRARVRLSELRLVEKTHKSSPQGAVSRKKAEMTATRESGSEIDLRGWNVEESLMEIDRFIDRCVILNVPSVTIIHGKGTGVLRAAVHKHLRGHPNVGAYRLGTFGEGEAGVTIAQLK